MIHDELGRCWVPSEEGPVAVDMHSPLRALLASEATLADDEGNRMAARVEAVRAFHGWVFAQGPHPRPVSRRLVLASLRFAPAAAQCLAREEVVAVTHAEFDVAMRSLIRALLNNPRAGARQVRSHAEVINAVLGCAYRRNAASGAFDSRGVRSIEALMQPDVALADDETEIRAEALREWLRPIWRGGALVEALKAFYALTRGFWPELVYNMTGEEIAAIFTQTRAAVSEREHRLINRPIARHLGRHVTLRHQKSVGACGRYAAAQMGNTHRADSVRTAA